jgi:hypothetical protein
LAQHIIAECKSPELPVSEIIFDYSSSFKKITILEPLVSASGWLSVNVLTIESLETEDHFLMCGVSDDGTKLDPDHCHRIFSLPGKIINRDQKLVVPPDVANLLNSALEKGREVVISQNSQRNAGFFDEELVKLEKWAEDKKSSLEIELKQLDIEIKILKAEARKLPKLEEKVKAQRHIKELEKRRNEMRMNLFKHQDEVDQRKESLISGIEARLKQMVRIKELFTIRWKIK